MFSDLVSDSIKSFVSDLVEDCINMFLQLLSGMNETTVAVLDLPVVNNGILYAQVLAGSILALKFSFEIWQSYILRINGDSDADGSGVFIRTAQAAAMLGAVPWLTKQIYMWGTAIANDIALMPGTDMNSGANIIDSMFMSVLTGGSPILIAGVAIIFALVIFLIILVQTFIRGAELAMIAAMGAFMAIGLTNPNSQTFSTWWKELLNLSMAQAIQMFLIKCSFFALTINPNPNVPMLSIMIFAGFIWVTYKSPSIMKQYVYSTGVGKGVGQTAQQAGSMILMRKIMTRGAA